MKLPKYSILILTVVTGPALWAEPAAVSPPVTPDPMAEALPILQSRYPDFPALHYKPGDKLGDLISRSSGKISLDAPDVILKPQPIVMTSLTDGIVYWRLASFAPDKSWMDLAKQVEQLAPSATGVILDLRSNVAPDDYHGAEQLMEWFTSSDTTLINFLGPPDSSGNVGVAIESRYSFHSPIVVLTNGQTIGAAEALATCLQADGALVVGQPTAGKMGLFQEQKLSSGAMLRYFVSPVWHLAPDAVFTFPNHHPVPWGQPVMPDIAMTVDDYNEKAALTLIRDNHILDVIQEADARHRLSEATLVLGQDPEWDDYLGKLERKPVLLSLPVIHDPVLVGALDSLKAIRLSQRTLPAPGSITASLPTSTSVQ